MMQYIPLGASLNIPQVRKDVKGFPNLILTNSSEVKILHLSILASNGDELNDMY